MDEKSFSLEKTAILTAGLILLFVSVTGFFGLNQTLYGKGSSYADTVSHEGLSESELSAWDFDIGELDIFRLILRNTNSFNPAQAYSLARVIYDECLQRGMDPSIVLGVIMVESSFQPTAVSHKGAMGLMQLMPNTGLDVAEREGIEILARKQLYDPEINVRLGIAYLSELETQYKNINHALGAYNYGPYNYDRKFGKADLKNIFPRYVTKVLKFKSIFDFELSNQRES